MAEIKRFTGRLTENDNLANVLQELKRRGESAIQASVIATHGPANYVIVIGPDADGDPKDWRSAYWKGRITDDGETGEAARRAVGDYIDLLGDRAASVKIVVVEDDANSTYLFYC